MSAYSGGLYQCRKRISQALIELETKAGTKDYVEPFCGMLGVARSMCQDQTRDCQVTDINKSLICLLRAVQSGEWKAPETITHQEYLEQKYSDHDSALRAFIGITGSFNSSYFGGSFRLDKPNKRGRNFVTEASNGLKRLQKEIEGCKNLKILDAQSYEDLPMYFNTLMFCDPPFRGNKLNSPLFRDFDSDKFWTAADTWSLNNVVCVLERSAPEHWLPILTIKDFYSTNNTTKGAKHYKQCLFIHKRWYSTLGYHAGAESSHRRASPK